MTLAYGPHETVLLAAVLSFISGYAFSLVPLIKAGLAFKAALRLVFAADTLSILAMTVVDNLLILIIPGAMDKDLSHPVYWISRILSLSAAFIVAYPLNMFLMKRGKGHALTQGFHHNH